MKKITSLLLGTAIVFMSAGWISSAGNVRQTGLQANTHPQHPMVCQRALAKIADPEQNTWKNRLAAWKCRNS